MPPIGWGKTHPHRSVRFFLGLRYSPIRPVPLGMSSHSSLRRSHHEGSYALWSSVHRPNPSAARNRVALKGGSPVPSKKGDRGYYGPTYRIPRPARRWAGTGSCSSQVTVIGFSPVQVSKRGLRSEERWGFAVAKLPVAHEQVDACARLGSLTHPTDVSVATRLGLAPLEAVRRKRQGGAYPSGSKRIDKVWLFNPC